MTCHSEAKSVPRVAVLLATYNGIRWIQRQVASVLGQQQVDVTLVVSDDISTDGTWEWLHEVAQIDDRIILLPRVEKFGGAAKNFYRLLLDIEISDYDYFALSDQDDIWEPGKLRRHVDIVQQESYVGLSSSVVAFWEDGRSRLIVKTGMQRLFDFLFESPGPGCSFLLTASIVLQVKTILRDPAIQAKDVLLHDWLIYAVCRATGGPWCIDDLPSLHYRQHTANEFGANVGFRAKLTRFNKLRGGWYRKEILKISTICAQISDDRGIGSAASLLNSQPSISRRFRLLPLAWQGRRKFHHRLSLCFISLVGWL